ncbi:MAG TPA: hypothetical protein VMT62_10770 [Syntrophorhabdaceae bacterium]|nr:hypothetical protein [Syntrophorhabdaceae bacterium]
MNLPFRFSLLLISAIIMVLQGCAAPEQRLDRQMLGNPASIKVARFEPVKLRKPTSGSKVAAATSYPLAVLTGGIGAGAAAATTLALESNAGEELSVRVQLPDYSEIVMGRFVETAQSEISDWPKMYIDNNVLRTNEAQNECLIAFRVVRARVAPASGLTISTDAEMFTPDKKRVWARRFTYRSSDFRRCTDLGMLEADQGKLLHEEWEYAAKQTVADFIAHLKGATGYAARSE